MTSQLPESTNIQAKQVAFLLLGDNKLDKDLLGKYMHLYGYDTIIASDADYEQFEQRMDEIAFLITNILKVDISESRLIMRIAEQDDSLPILAVMENSASDAQLNGNGRKNLFTIKKPLKCRDVYSRINQLIDLVR